MFGRLKGGGEVLVNIHGNFIGMFDQVCLQAGQFFALAQPAIFALDAFGGA